MAIGERVNYRKCEHDQCSKKRKEEPHGHSIKKEKPKIRGRKTYSKPKSTVSEFRKIDWWTCDVYFPALVHLRILSGRLNTRLLIRLDLLTTQTK